MSKSHRRKNPANWPKWATDENLNDQEFRFVASYIVHLNMTQAAVDAGLGGVSRGAASARGSELMRRPHVARAADKALLADGSGARTTLTERLSAISRADIADLFVWKDGVIEPRKDLPPEMKGLIKEIEVTKRGKVKVKLHDPLRAIELLAKHRAVMLTRENLGTLGKLTLEDLVNAAARKEDED